MKVVSRCSALLQNCTSLEFVVLSMFTGTCRSEELHAYLCRQDIANEENPADLGTISIIGHFGMIHAVDEKGAMRISFLLTMLSAQSKAGVKGLGVAERSKECTGRD